MLSLRASSSASNARRRRAAMSPMTVSSAALLLLRGAYADSSNTSLSPEYDNAIIESHTPFPPATDVVTPTLLRATARAARSLSTPTANTTQKQIKYSGNPPPYLMGECEGDCDDDGECGEGLVCFQRDKNEAVPGCIGGENDGSATDFCVRTDTASPTTALTASPTTSSPASPTMSASPTALPSMSSAPTLLPPTTDIVTPTPLPSRDPPAPSLNTPTANTNTTQKQIKFVSNPPESPLGECEGDCDNDGQCREGFICFQRETNQAVPGCNGGENDSSTTDYCVRTATFSPTTVPTTSPTMSASPTALPSMSSAPTVSLAPSNQPSLNPTSSPTVTRSAPVRLRMYWQSSYYWQESHAEKWWCMQCRDGACKNGSTIEIDTCGGSDRQKFQYYGDQTYRPMTNAGLCFEENGWDSESNPIKLKPCNGSSKQRWVGFNAKKRTPFEIFAGRNQRYLLTQAHHPKAHERVFPQQAGRARSHTTSKWVSY